MMTNLRPVCVDISKFVDCCVLQPIRELLHLEIKMSYHILVLLTPGIIKFVEFGYQIGHERHRK
jgi:hypothetical protein